MSGKRKAITAPEAPETPEEFADVLEWQEPPADVLARVQVLMRRRAFHGSFVQWLNFRLLRVESDEVTAELISEILASVGHGSTELNDFVWEQLLPVLEQTR